MDSSNHRLVNGKCSLQQQGTLNLRPEDVIHPLFQDSEFFDAHDLVQVKYEMLRQVRVDKRPISQAAKEFSRSAQRSQAYTGDDAVRGRAAQRRAIAGFAQLAEAVKRKFNLRVHPRSIERQLLREKN